MAKQISKSAPRSSRKKSWVHTFYLIQPVMQFLALVATLVLFSRCSPLAPSTDKSSTLQLNASTGNRPSQQAEDAAREDSIQKSFKELSQGDLTVISVEELQDKKAEIKDSFLANKSFIETSFERKRQLKKYKGALIGLHLDKKQAEALMQGKDQRIAIHELVRYRDEETLLHFLRHLDECYQKDGLKAKVYLTAPEAALQQNPDLGKLLLPIQVSIGFPTENQAFIELKLRTQTPEEKDASVALLKSGADHWNTLSIILE